MATTPFFGWIKPVVGASADVWGGLLNAIFDMMDTQLSSLPNTIKGNNTGSQAAQADLTPVQVAAMLPTATGAASTGLKGLVPAQVASDANRVLTGNGDFRSGIGRCFGCLISTTNIAGSQPVLNGAFNVASISTLSVVGSQASATLTFATPIPFGTVYQVHVQAENVFQPATYSDRLVGSVVVYWQFVGSTPSEISVSGF